MSPRVDEIEVPIRVKLDDFEVRRLQLKPGDIIVLSTAKRLSEAQVIQIRARAEEMFEGHKVVILQDMSIAVVPSTETAL